LDSGLRREVGGRGVDQVIRLPAWLRQRRYAQSCPSEGAVRDPAERRSPRRQL